MIDKLKLNPNNPRFIKDRDFNRLKESIKNFPEMLELRPIVYDNENIILGGNMRFRALQALQKEGFEVKDTYFKSADNLTPEQYREFVIKDNIQQGEWDSDILANEWSDLPLDEWGIDTAGWKSNEVVEDEAPELPETPQSKLGEVYQLGRHRLMCGDSTKIEDVEKLMNGQKADMVFTDPPYGVEYTGGTKEWEMIRGDEKPNLYYDALVNCYSFTVEKAPAYLWYSDSKSQAVTQAVTQANWERRCTIIWNKNQAQFGALSAQYKTKHEPMFYLYKKGKTPSWYGATNEVTVWECPRASVNEFHPTQKPVELPARAIKNSSKKDNIVLDLFGGSGSTLIACEQLDRTCYMMELDPKYCDVIRKRYAKFIGKEEEWQTI